MIGAGVPASWTAKPMRVHGLPTSQGLVDWDWNDGKMQVTVHGARSKLRLGPAFFPAGASLVTEPKQGRS